ncbi:MAG: hypothetical protein NZ927_02180 [Candidatus Calescibacterium sp.]|nr:hypothetical protein [Candidatus Calescibacterium sp.]MCX7734367.1 hypothetical protein [bacterium]MDW8086869.1 hypothetical protein [Candidatus Calescibacterium sp.]
MKKISSSLILSFLVLILTTSGLSHNHNHTEGVDNLCIACNITNNQTIKTDEQKLFSQLFTFEEKYKTDESKTEPEDFSEISNNKPRDPPI